MTDLVAVLAVARKDFLQELRSRATTVATLFFSAITLVMMAFGLGREPTLMASAAPGVLWVALAFAGVIASAQSFQADLEEGALEQLLLLPVSRASLYLGKLLASWAYLSALGVVMLPLAFGLYGASAPPETWWVLILTVLLGTLGFAVIATFYAGLTANLQAREALLPVLMFPVVVPVMLGAVRATEAALLGSAEVGLASSWLQLLAGFDLVYLVVCSNIFHFVVDD
ncbi:MAG: heme exporter protein CcmB [Trueperaceae bacterium]|nr:heme exporter protein CcmB [Trueperaceae bacterium]HRQ09433.1 heme exporter protein CcmB [Trueperaceae bacterium]